MHGLVDTAGWVDGAAGGLDGAARRSRSTGWWPPLVPVPGCGAGWTGATCRSPGRWPSVDARSEQTLADAGRTSPRDAAKVVERVETTDTVPALGAALQGGDVSAGHVDVVAAVLRQVEPDVRAVLVDNGTWLARRATVLSPAELRRELTAEVRALEADGGTGPPGTATTRRPATNLGRSRRDVALRRPVRP